MIQRAAGGRDLIPVAVGAAAFVVAGVQTALRPVDALANNGDFNRVLTSLGLRPVGVNRFPYPYAQLAFTHGHISSHGAYRTSYLPILRAVTSVATPLVGGTFDLRVLGLMFSAALGVVVFAVCRHFTSWAAQLGAGTILVLGLADAHLVAYFDSFYDEPWSMLALSACVVALLKNNGRRKVPARSVLIWTAVGVVLVTAKTQNAPLLLPVAAATLLLSVDSRRHGSGRLSRKALPIGCSAVLVAVSFAYVLAQPSAYSQDNLYDQVFAELLVHSSHPQADLVALGLPTSMVKYGGTNAYAAHSGINTTEFQHFASHGGRHKVELFYLSHPSQAVKAIGRGIKEGMHARLTYLSYRTASSGAPPGADGCGLCLFSAASSGAAGTSPLPLVALYAIALSGAIIRRRRGRNGLSDVTFFLTAVSLVSLLTAVFGEGSYEEIKHLYLFYVSNIMILASTTGLCLDLAGSHRSEVSRADPDARSELSGTRSAEAVPISTSVDRQREGSQPVADTLLIGSSATPTVGRASRRRPAKCRRFVGTGRSVIARSYVRLEVRSML